MKVVNGREQAFPLLTGSYLPGNRMEAVPGKSDTCPPPLREMNLLDPDLLISHLLITKAGSIDETISGIGLHTT